MSVNWRFGKRERNATFLLHFLLVLDFFVAAAVLLGALGGLGLLGSLGALGRTALDFEGLKEVL